MPHGVAAGSDPGPPALTPAAREEARRVDGAWMFMRGAMIRAETPRAVRRGTVRRVFAFARPHWPMLAAFLVLTVVSAALAVSTPVLAGRVVDAIVRRHEVTVVVWLAVLIAVIAVLDAGLGVIERWQSAR